MDQQTLRSIINELRLRGQEWKSVDAKRELILRENGDKAEFVKDVLAMANNGEPSYILIGLEDGTLADVGRLAHHFDQNTINQILEDKTDPPIVVEYKEFLIQGNEYALIEVAGDNPPYLVARDFIFNKTDRKQTRIYKGTIYVRHEDRTEGISRAELDELARKREPKVVVGLERVRNAYQKARKRIPLRLYLGNDGPTAAMNIRAMLWFTGCKLYKCPDYEHSHIGRHAHDQSGKEEDEYREESLVIDIPVLHSIWAAPTVELSLVPTQRMYRGIGITIKGSNFETRTVSIDLKDIRYRYRKW